MAKYKSKLKRNSKYNPKSKRFLKYKAFSSPTAIQVCEEKMTFPTINKARQAKKAIGKPLSIYKCPNCKKYHLTSE